MLWDSPHQNVVHEKDPLVSRWLSIELLDRITRHWVAQQHRGNVVQAETSCLDDKVCDQVRAGPVGHVTRTSRSCDQDQ